MQPDRGVDVLGDRLRRHATDLRQGRCPDNGARPAPEGAAPAILAGLEDSIEERLLVEAFCGGPVARRGRGRDPAILVLE